jgi:PAS domain S-box-containing protein
MKSLDISKYLEKIISTMNDGLMIIAPDGKVRMVNQAFENLTGFQGTEVVGKPCTLLNCDPCEKTLREGAPWWCDLFEKGEVIRKRCVIVRKDGSYQPVIRNASLRRVREDRVGASAPPAPAWLGDPFKGCLIGCG